MSAEMPANIVTLLLLLVPIILLQVALMIVALVDLLRREHTKGPKWMWLAVIVLVSLFGPIIYFVVGREE
jgi:hypothetical protein